MKRTILISLLLLSGLLAWSQELSKREQRQLIKQLKQEQRAEELAHQSALVKAMIEQHCFVLEAYQLRNTYGYTTQVNSSINFVAADSVSGVIQIGQNAYVGANGVGGITVEGQISGYKYKQDPKNGTFTVNYHVSATGGNYDVRLVAFSDGRAEASISSNWPGTLTYVGNLVPPGISRVFKGRSL
ncbi:MAG: hypothetical protein CSA96_03750 [Bacteroidetes bacterium]|nr:MAG: hypothetical protein CSA96_03750 [Bacteroidota bacterium]